MRVFAIAHGLAQACAEGLGGRPGLTGLTGEPGADGAVIGCRAGKGARRQGLAQGKAGGALGAQSRQHLGHILRRGADGHIGVVL